MLFCDVGGGKPPTSIVHWANSHQPPAATRKHCKKKLDEQKFNMPCSFPWVPLVLWVERNMCSSSRSLFKAFSNQWLKTLWTMIFWSSWTAGIQPPQPGITNINRDPSLDTGHTIWSIPLPQGEKNLNRELLHPCGWKKILRHFQKNGCFQWTWHRNSTNSYSPVVGIDRLTIPFLTSFSACDPWVFPSPHSTKLQIHVAIGRHGSITTCHIQNCGPRLKLRKVSWDFSHVPCPTSKMWWRRKNQKLF